MGVFFIGVKRSVVSAYAPTVMGILVVLSGEDFNDSQKSAIAGKKNPEKTPMNIARKIQSVRYLSRNFNLGFIKGIFENYNGFSAVAVIL